MPRVLFNQQSAVKLVIFWVHNLRPSLDGMRPTRCMNSPTNGTPNRLQDTVIKDFRHGLQIRPRRFDSGFGLHIRKPRRSRSAGFFYACDLAYHFRNFWDRFRKPLPPFHSLMRGGGRAVRFFRCYILLGFSFWKLFRKLYYLHVSSYFD